jgi:predicted transcriptional regulator
MFGFFKAKKEVRRVEEETKKGFGKIKEDFSKIGKWITYFDEKEKVKDEEIKELREQIKLLEEDLGDIKEAIHIFGVKLSKHPQTAVHKQTTPVDVQTAVQTAVQTSILDNLTISERSIVLALLYSDMKLSYEDLAAMLGKDRSTIRGQINAIKQKSESLIKEYIEVGGKKRLYIPEEIAKLITKSVKVRVKKDKKAEKYV